MGDSGPGRTGRRPDEAKLWLEGSRRCEKQLGRVSPVSGVHQPSGGGGRGRHEVCLFPGWTTPRPGLHKALGMGMAFGEDCKCLLPRRPASYRPFRYRINLFWRYPVV